MRKRIFHGKSKTREYTSWKAMTKRCLNPNDPSYAKYGGRGIEVCERWLGMYGFVNFLEDMGERPPNTSLDRTDNDGNYTPENCRWATRREQQLNRTANYRITHRGITKTYMEWAKHLNINHNTLYKRLKRWPVEKALSEVVNTQYRSGVSR